MGNIYVVLLLLVVVHIELQFDKVLTWALPNANHKLSKSKVNNKSDLTVRFTP